MESMSRSAWIGFFGEQFKGSHPDTFGTLTYKTVHHDDCRVVGDSCLEDKQCYVPGVQASGKDIKRLLDNVDKATLIVEEFGKKNGRRHFHFVSQMSTHLSEQLERWKMYNGFIKVETMQSELACLGYVSKYMSKEIDGDTGRFWINWKGM